MNSEFSKDIQQGGSGRHARSFEGRLMYPFFVLIACLFAVGWVGLYGLLFMLVIELLLTLYLGFQGFSEYQIFSNTPIAKIDGAANGLTEISANVYPYSKAGYDNPLEESKCAYYNLQLHYRTGGKNSHDYIISEVRYSVPSLLYDGTGYIFCDFSSAEFEMPYIISQVLDKKWFDMSMRNELIQAFNDTAGPGQKLQVDEQGSNLGLGRPRKGVSLSSGLTAAKGPIGYYIRLNYVPIGTPYFAIGSISDDGKTYSGKPLKMMSVDQSSGIFAVTTRSKQQAMSRLLRFSIINLVIALGCVAVIVALFNSKLI